MLAAKSIHLKLKPTIKLFMVAYLRNQLTIISKLKRYSVTHYFLEVLFSSTDKELVVVIYMDVNYVVMQIVNSSLCLTIVRRYPSLSLKDVTAWQQQPEILFIVFFL